MVAEAWTAPVNIAPGITQAHKPLHYDKIQL